MPSEDRAQTINERVYLKRVGLFFGHGVANVLSVFLGAILLAIVLNDANVTWQQIAFWYAAIFILGCIVLVIEQAFKKATLSLQNAKKWVLIRIVPGAMVGAMYGVTPFLFSEHLAIHHEMFIFIIFSAMISVGSTGYSIMPMYYFILNAGTMLPLTVYFLLTPSSFHMTLAITCVIWQFVVLSKSWKVSKTAINEILLNENLRDEINRHEETKQKLQHMATHDALTGLPNRRLLMDRLASIIKLAQRMKKQAVIMFVDLDGFKAVNDIHGHECGDVILLEIANRLLATIRESDTVARVGGDEFVLAYTEMAGGREEVEILTQRIIESLEKPITLPDGSAERITASIGLALFPDNGKQARALINAADKAMYRVKNKGKNNYSFA